MILRIAMLFPIHSSPESMIMDSHTSLPASITLCHQGLVVYYVTTKRNFHVVVGLRLFFRPVRRTNVLTYRARQFRKSDGLRLLFVHHNTLNFWIISIIRYIHGGISITTTTTTTIIMAAATATSTSIISTPNNTLYVSNIDWKIKKPLLKRALYMLFTRHGKVLEIISLRREGLRGQAWVIMDDVQAATAAVQSANGFSFFGKDLKVSYAKETSDRIAKRDGSYVPKAKRQKMKQQQQQQEPPPPPATAATTTTEGGDDDMTGNGGGGGGDGGGGGADGSSEGGGGTVVPPPPPPPPPAAAASQTPTEKPSHILFAQELPDECNEMMLGMLFRQYKGFKEVRIPRPGLAFIEFETEAHATIAYEALNGFKLTTTDTLKLSYGKA